MKKIIIVFAIFLFSLVETNSIYDFFFEEEKKNKCNLITFDSIDNLINEYKIIMNKQDVFYENYNSFKESYFSASLKREFILNEYIIFFDLVKKHNAILSEDGQKKIREIKEYLSYLITVLIPMEYLEQYKKK